LKDPKRRLYCPEETLVMRHPSLALKTGIGLPRLYPGVTLKTNNIPIP